VSDPPLPPFPVVSGAGFTFRRLRRDDFELLGRWLEAPHVARWWNHEYSPEAIERDFGDAIDGREPAEDYLALLEGEPVGVVQYSRFDEYPEYGAELAPVYPVGPGTVSIDYLIGDRDRIGRGVGTAMIRAFVERVWVVDEGASAVVVPVNSANVASWRALERAGFLLVARGELEPDNPIDNRWHEILRIDRPG
jgi:aminoglycoside 6'-N-acetyltransferase